MRTCLQYSTTHQYRTQWIYIAPDLGIFFDIHSIQYSVLCLLYRISSPDLHTKHHGMLSPNLPKWRKIPKLHVWYRSVVWCEIIRWTDQLATRWSESIQMKAFVIHRVTRAIIFSSSLTCTCTSIGITTLYSEVIRSKGKHWSNPITSLGALVNWILIPFTNFCTRTFFRFFYQIPF